MGFDSTPPGGNDDEQGIILSPFDEGDEQAVTPIYVDVDEPFDEEDSPTLVDIEASLLPPQPEAAQTTEEPAHTIAHEIAQAAVAARSTSSLRAMDPYWSGVYNPTCNIFGHDEAWYRTSTVIEVVDFFLLYYPGLLDLFDVSSAKAFDALVVRRFQSPGAYESGSRLIKLCLRDLVYAISIDPDAEKAEETIRRIMAVIYGR